MTDITTIIQLIPLEHYVILCLALFSIGKMGVLFRRNTIIILMCIELMLNSVNLLLAAFSAYRSVFSPRMLSFRNTALRHDKS